MNGELEEEIQGLGGQLECTSQLGIQLRLEKWGLTAENVKKKKNTKKKVLENYTIITQYCVINKWLHLAKS